MPLSDNEVGDVRSTLLRMYDDTIKTFRLLREHVSTLFPEHGTEIGKAIDEYLKDFVDSAVESEEKSETEQRIDAATREDLERAGFYGAQLELKKRQVTDANRELRASLRQPRSFFRSPFKKWVERINNFLGSLVAAVGAGEALKELKDCLAGELPDKD